MLSRRSLAILSLSLAVVIALLLHAPLINGPWYWQWPWRTLSIRRTLLLCTSLLPTFLALLIFRSRPSLAIALLALGSFCLRIEFAIVQDPNLHLDWLDAVVRSPSAISYYVDAAILNTTPHWLTLYPIVLHQLHLHTQSKPPGPVAWYSLWIRWLGYGRQSAIAGAVAIGALQSLVIPATAWMVRQLTGRREAAFFAAAFVALCPSATLPFPAMDPFYGVLTCGILIFADRTLRRPTMLNSIVAGVILAIAAFCTYVILTLGTFVLAFAMLLRPAARKSPTLLIGVPIGFLLFYSILWLITGFDPWATFVAAWHNQHILLAAHASERPYPLTAVFDLTDFSLGLGWIGWIAIGSFPRDRFRWLCILCIAQPALIAITGLLQSETFRVWNFMLPLVAIPAGLALASWRERERRVYFVCAAFVFIAVARNLTFLVP